MTSISLISRIRSLSNIISPKLTIWINIKLFDYLNKCVPSDIILNLGSGVGQFDKYVNDDLKFINMDIQEHKDISLLGDAHFLPFKDGALDAVYSNAVLEHVEKPWIVARELYRVLKPGGKIFINVPFLNVIHDVHDYFRFTDKGLESLFSDFEKIEVGVSAGPSSFVGPFLIEYFSNFLPGNILKILFRLFMTLIIWPIKYLDLPIKNSNRLRITADAFYYIGQKPLT